MTYNPLIHHRRSIRLKEYDYSQAGLYFITFCCQNRRHLFGKIIDGKMILNDAGKIAKKCWLDIPDHFKNVILHDFIIMPNHVHGIIEFTEKKDLDSTAKAIQHLPKNVSSDGANASEKDFSHIFRSPSKTIGSVIRGYKIGVTKWMRQNTNVTDIWHRNYYEHIIRNDTAYYYISEYIKKNPTTWNEDKFY